MRKDVLYLQLIGRMLKIRMRETATDLIRGSFCVNDVFFAFMANLWKFLACYDTVWVQGRVGAPGTDRNL